MTNAFVGIQIAAFLLAAVLTAVIRQTIYCSVKEKLNFNAFKLEVVETPDSNTVRADDNRAVDDLLIASGKCMCVNCQIWMCAFQLALFTGYTTTLILRTVGMASGTESIATTVPQDSRAVDHRATRFYFLLRFYQ